MANLSNTATANQVAFGQLGSAFSDLAANTIRPPEGLAIVAIQCLTDTLFSSLVAKDPATTINTASAAHTAGLFTRKVNQGTGASTKIIFDDTNAASGVAVGDEIYQTTGALLATVVALDPDGDNANEIQISSSQTITDDEVLSFLRPNVSSANKGVGGLALANDNTFPKGITIYGRWDSVSLNNDTSSIICYFG